MSIMILDAGNSIIKAKIARRQGGEVSFPHALRRLTETEYANIINRTGVTSPAYISERPQITHSTITEGGTIPKFLSETYGRN